jgi:hypothetical protein
MVEKSSDLVNRILEHNPDGEVPKKIGSSFFRGEHVNFNPYLKDYLDPEFLEKFFLKGWLPETPWIEKTTRITAFGSCFAVNISKHLAKAGFNLTSTKEPSIYVSSMGEGMVNVHALLQQFEWAFEDIEPPHDLWHGYKAEKFGYNEGVKKRTRAAFLETDLFIITLGLSEIWYDEKSGGVFWRAVPLEHYDPLRHKFRVCSMSETKEKIAHIDALIQKHVPQAKVLFTLSPIPLAASFRPVGCISANSVSKAILRAALDEFLRENWNRVNRSIFYWPSYEVVQDLFPFRFGADARHPLPGIIPLIMKMFEAAHCISGLSLADMRGEYQSLRQTNIRHGRRLITTLEEEARIDAPNSPPT